MGGADPGDHGALGVAEVIVNLEEGITRSVVTPKSGSVPTFQDWRIHFTDPAGIGARFFIGILPGAAPVIPPSVPTQSRKNSLNIGAVRHRVIEGVAGPEAANNAATGGAFIPLFTLGFVQLGHRGPAGGLMIYGIQPGPMMITKYPDLFWGP